MGNKILKYTCAVSVVTDVMIMALPLWMIRTLQIRGAQKAGLAFIFLLGLIIIAFEILRTVKSLGKTTFSEVAVYDIAENFIAIIVSCAATYRSLITIHQRRHPKSSRYANLKYWSKNKTDDSHQLRLVKEGSEVSTGHVSGVARGDIPLGLPERAFV
ncbi:MAG: hypothetical protein Q9172_007542 [Xanthocarpia lactea]